MKYEDLSFIKENENGESVLQDIICVVPNKDNDDCPYVIYTDYTLDENDEFIKEYGMLAKEEDNFVLKPIVDKNLIDEIEALSQNEIVKYVNEQINENIS